MKKFLLYLLAMSVSYASSKPLLTPDQFRAPKIDTSYQSLFDVDIITGTHIILDSNYQNFNSDGTLLYGIKAGFTMNKKHALELAYFQTLNEIEFSNINTTIDKTQLAYIIKSSEYNVIHVNASLNMGIGTMRSTNDSDDFLYVGGHINTVVNLSRYIKVVFHIGYETSKGLNYNNQNDDSIGNYVGGFGLVYGNY